MVPRPRTAAVASQNFLLFLFGHPDSVSKCYEQNSSGFKINPLLVPVVCSTLTNFGVKRRARASSSIPNFSNNCDSAAFARQCTLKGVGQVGWPITCDFPTTVGIILAGFTAKRDRIGALLSLIYLCFWLFQYKFFLESFY